MYKNVGRKIKGLSIFLAWILVFIGGFYASYRLFSGKMTTNNIIISVFIFVGGCLLGLFVSWIIYGFGVIVESAEKNREDIETVILSLDEISSKLNTPIASGSSVRVQEKSNVDLPGSFKLPETREELFASQLRKLKKDYEMSRITYDEYEAGKKRLEEKYK